MRLSCTLLPVHITLLIHGSAHTTRFHQTYPSTCLTVPYHAFPAVMKISQYGTVAPESSMKNCQAFVVKEGEVTKSENDVCQEISTLIICFGP